MLNKTMNFAHNKTAGWTALRAARYGKRYGSMSYE